MLEQTGSIHGVLLQTNSETPAASQEIRYGIEVVNERRSSSHSFGGRAVTDSEGKFSIKGLVPGWEYELYQLPRSDGILPQLEKVEVKSGQNIDLGKLAIPAPRKRYVRPTLDERIAKAMGIQGTVQERFERGPARLKLAKQKLLVVLGAADEARMRRYMQLRYEDKDYRKVRDDFLPMVISTEDAKKAAQAKELLDDLQADSSQQALEFSLVIVSEEGKLIDQKSGDDLVKEGELSKESLIEWLGSHVGDRVDARKLFDKTLARAEKENKRVIVQETATWCGPCHVLSKHLDEHRDWEADYIWIKMDHRFTGARELMKELRDGAKGGIPWFVIVDSRGKKLASSNHFKSGENIGFPSSFKGRAHLRKMLIDTRLSMSDEEIDAFVAHFKK